MAILSSLIGGTMKIFKNTLYLFDSTIFEQGAYFPKIIFIYKIKGNTNILNQDIQKEDVYLPDFFFKTIRRSHREICFFSTK